jgi:hypothetical protein
VDDIQKITDHVEYLFLKLIVRGLREHTITPEQASGYAREFLPIEPFQSFEDARTKIHAYVTTHGHFTSLQAFIDGLHEEQESDRKVESMKKLIKENKIDEAIQIAKG